MRLIELWKWPSFAYRTLLDHKRRWTADYDAGALFDCGFHFFRFLRISSFKKERLFLCFFSLDFMMENLLSNFSFYSRFTYYKYSISNRIRVIYSVYFLYLLVLIISLFINKLTTFEKTAIITAWQLLKSKFLCILSLIIDIKTVRIEW